MVRLVPLIVRVVLSALVVAAPAAKARADSLEGPFSADSTWRQPIPDNAEIDPNSAAMVTAIMPRAAMFANLAAFGIPVYTVSSDSPRYSIACNAIDWGPCPFFGLSVPIPVEAAPSPGSDGAMVTVDELNGVIYEFWQARKDGDQWSAQWGAVNSLRGPGWGGSATGSGASRLAGVVRVAEIAGGVIPHALALQTNNVCTNFRPPALKSDGTSARGDCIPEGVRLQLDPSLDLGELGLTRGELAVATAMQRYGGFIVDVGGAPLSVSFELDISAAPDNVGAVYEDAGFRWDYDSMEHVPWGMLRVLK